LDSRPPEPQVPTYRVPKSTLKRYWNRNLISKLYMTLLNHESITEPADLMELVGDIHMYIRSNASHDAKLRGVLHRLVEYLALKR
jgi:hypothetical protein